MQQQDNSAPATDLATPRRLYLGSLGMELALRAFRGESGLTWSDVHRLDRALKECLSIPDEDAARGHADGV